MVAKVASGSSVGYSFAEVSVQVSLPWRAGNVNGAWRAGLVSTDRLACVRTPPYVPFVGRTAQAGWAKGEANVLEGSLRIKHSEVSERHAELCFREGSSAPVWLRDLGSRNGTQVMRKTRQGKKQVLTVGGGGPGCVADCEIRKGDHLTFPGHVVLLVQELAFAQQVPVEAQQQSRVRVPSVRRALVRCFPPACACPPCLT